MEKPPKPNYYQLLNVSPDSKIDDIIGSFLEISRKFSIFPYATTTEIRRIDKRFIEYKEAYQVLTTVDERLKYDLQHGFKNNSWLEGNGGEVEKIKMTKDKAHLQDTLIRMTFSKHSLDASDIEQFKIEKAKRRFKKARTFITQEKYHEAINLLRELINQGGKDANYHSYLGFALMKKGWASYAQNEFKRALEYDPENLLAREFYIDRITSRLDPEVELLPKSKVKVKLNFLQKVRNFLKGLNSPPGPEEVKGEESAVKGR